MNHKGFSFQAVAVLCAAVSASVIADEYTLKVAPQSIADWKDGSFYANGVAPTDANVSDAVVKLPADMTAKVNDGSVAFVSSFERIIPQHRTSSVLEIDISSDASLGCAFYYAARKNANDIDTRGRIVKKGIGKLSLANTTSTTVYFTDIQIDSGTVELAPRGGNQDHFYGRIDVADGAMLIPGHDASNPVRNWMIHLGGSGIVSNGVGSAENCVILPGYGEGYPVEFSGRILDKIMLYQHGWQHYTGTSSTYSGNTRMQSNGESLSRGIVGVMKMGKKGEASSIGTGSMVLGEYGGRMLYLGSGETSDKDISLSESPGNSPGIIDAGANGGLRLTGSISATAGTNQRLWLTGSNTTECVIDGSMNVNGSRRMYVTKKGTGTWRLGDVARTDISGIAVEDGTLRFDSLREKGSACSVGNGAIYTIDKWYNGGETNVPYQFKLGTTTTEGVLEFTGSNDAYAAQRPIALAGDGTLRNSGTTNLIFHGGVSSLVARQVTLTLDGDSSSEAVVSSVSNGVGAVSVIKEGSGTWILDGTNNTFTGDIDVKSGTLVLRGLGGFDWYRWTIRGNRQGGTFERISEFAFFDKDNLRTGLNLVMAGADVSSANYDPPVYRENVFPGSVALGRRQGYIGSGCNTQNMFDGVCNTYGALYLWIGGWSTRMIPTPDNPSTWVTFVLRLAEGASEPKSYDWASWGGTDSGKPKSWLLEGSHDGLVWYEIDDVTDGPGTPEVTDTKRYSFQWAFNKSGSADASGSAMGTAEAPHENGRRFTVLEAASPVIYSQTVSVATDSVLEGVGDIVLSSLKVEPTSGGMIRNVSFATNGSIDIASKFDGSEVVVPLTFDNVNGLENVANWSVSVGGVPNVKHKVSVKGGRICVTKPAFVVVIR